MAIPPSHVLWALAAFVAGVALWALWLAWVQRHYRILVDPGVHFQAQAADGWRLAGSHRAANPRRFLEPVILCHGLAANRYTFDFEPPYSLAHYLADAGFECISIELRGTGRSAARPPSHRWKVYTVDDHIRLDAPALVRAALERTGAPRAFWLGHSLGGLVGYGFAQADGAELLAGLLALGSPVFFPYDRLLRAATRLGVWASWPLGLRHRLLSLTLAPLLGRFTLPLSDVVINPVHIEPLVQRKVYANLMSAMGRGVLRQLDDWIRTDSFRSSDGAEDYREGLKRLRLPLLVMGGTSDRLATPEAVKAQYELAGSTDKTLMLFGKTSGDQLDYGHGDLLYGTGAPREVYPRIGRWLESHATRL